MKIKIILLLTLLAATASATAQVAKHRHEDPYNEADKYIESAVIPMGGKKGFSFETRAGDFMLKPYSAAPDGRASSTGTTTSNSGWTIRTTWRTAASRFPTPFWVFRAGRSTS